MKRKTGAPYKGDEARWAAVVTKDRAADGRFWFSVATTGIYCRPSCASRPALRKNVRFHTSPTEAEAAGFRPCKRCCPALGQLPLDTLRIEAALREGEASPPLATLARLSGLSPHHFHRLFRGTLGLIPKSYADALRGVRLRHALALKTKPTVTEALHASGFNAASRFYQTASRLLGMTPAIYRQGGAGETIRFSHARTFYGLLLVAVTEGGPCFIALGTSAATLERDLRATFPQAAYLHRHAALGETLSEVVATLSLSPALPADIAHIVFQHRVRESMRAQAARFST